MNEDGNIYVLTTTAKGIPTFKHSRTGENLHGQVGPWQEAFHLYLTPSDLLNATGEVVIYDVGMGCAAQTLASFYAFERNPALESLYVISFDLEKQGIKSLLDHISLFEYAMPFASKLEEMLHNNLVTWKSEDNRTLTWQFMEGDFRSIIHEPLFQKAKNADFIFYDFFSPASHPYLWEFELFQVLCKKTSPTGILITYSCATAVRAALAAAGYFVGFGVPSGKKAKSTLASKSFTDLKDPLPPTWKNTFERSHIKYVTTESEKSQLEINTRISVHPQFRC